MESGTWKAEFWLAKRLKQCILLFFPAEQGKSVVTEAGFRDID